MARKRRKPPKCLARRKGKKKRRHWPSDGVVRGRTDGRWYLRPHVERLVVPGEGAEEGVADRPLGAVVVQDELVVLEVIRQLVVPHERGAAIGAGPLPRRRSRRRGVAPPHPTPPRFRCGRLHRLVSLIVRDPNRSLRSLPSSVKWTRVRRGRGVEKPGCEKLERKVGEKCTGRVRTRGESATGFVRKWAVQAPLEAIDNGVHPINCFLSA
ncbi:hypothetical protein BHE74_00021703 [Ensete ventricosum]|uniref:Uncharacterized protein n=1 Tax=Ensete ventricosum TaxID=4639 RepID=A0A445M8W1_ENSVE|nr:hypothetical protein BHE74_00021703 [Ensete ventricosum]RZR70683.1 hypothetical protein BHM03_00001065 [Ensete ventricosum]